MSARPGEDSLRQRRQTFEYFQLGLQNTVALCVNATGCMAAVLECGLADLRHSLVDLAPEALFVGMGNGQVVHERLKR